MCLDSNSFSPSVCTWGSNFSKTWLCLSVFLLGGGTDCDLLYSSLEWQVICSNGSQKLATFKSRIWHSSTMPTRQLTPPTFNMHLHIRTQTLCTRTYIEKLLVVFPLPAHYLFVAPRKDGEKNDPCPTEPFGSKGDSKEKKNTRTIQTKEKLESRYGSRVGPKGR